MVAPFQTETHPEVIYPESDGKPMADNTKQFEWIVLIKKNLDLLFIDEKNVFVAGDLLWYPVQGKPNIVNAPDVMVVLGRPKGDRGSYLQWNEDNIPPQVVFEILSPSNRKTEMERKLLFYDRHGVEEYYLYDPQKNELSGWLRLEGYLDAIEPIAEWVSPRLNIKFDISGEELRLYRPDGERFLSYVEVAQKANVAAQRAERLAQRLREMGIDPEQV